MGCTAYQIKKKVGKIKLKKNFKIRKLSSVEIKNIINQNLNKKTAQLKNNHDIYREDDVKFKAKEYKKINIKLNLENKPLTDDKTQKERINKYENLKVDTPIEMILKMKESNIVKIYELSNNRIAVIKREMYDFKEEEIKIYSLNTFKLLFEIKFKEKTKNIVELKNKDLVRATSSSIEFYK